MPWQWVANRDQSCHCIAGVYIQTLALFFLPVSILHNLWFLSNRGVYKLIPTLSIIHSDDPGVPRVGTLNMSDDPGVGSLYLGDGPRGRGVDER